MNIIEKSLIGEIQDYYNSYLNLGDGYIVDLVLAARISLRFKKPLWLCIQGSPSSGKTEILNMLKETSHLILYYQRLMPVMQKMQ